MMLYTGQMDQNRRVMTIGCMQNLQKSLSDVASMVDPWTANELGQVHQMIESAKFDLLQEYGVMMSLQKIQTAYNRYVEAMKRILGY